MKVIRRIFSLWAAAVLVLLPVCTAAAQTGSVTVRMIHQGEAVPGGSITLYRIATLSYDGRYLPEPQLEGCGVDLNSALTPASAEKLADYAAQRGLRGQTLSLGPEGKAVFPGLDTGLYLLVQKEAGRGYLPVEPFFVGIPQRIGGELVYDVEAGPKCAPQPVPGAPDIPQTGQLRWPVPVMAALGLAFFAAGGMLWRPGRRDDDEP